MSKLIYLRDLQISDALSLYTTCLDEDLRKNGVSFYNSVEESLATINVWNSSSDNTSVHKAIIDATDHNFVGIISLGDMNRYKGYYELEYAISPEKRNKGYATQAVSDMIGCAFEEMEAEVIAAWVRSHNKSSMRVLEKCRFLLEGRLRRHARDKGDTLCYSITVDDWLKKQPCFLHI